MRHKTILKTLSLLWLSVFLSYNNNAQCDVSITGVDVNTYEVTVEVINSERCGSQGYNGTNSAINMLMIGMHVPGYDIPWDPDAEGPCDMSPTSNHLGWTYGSSINSLPNNWANSYDIDMPLQAGDIVVMQLDNPYGTDCVDDPFLTGSMGCCAPDYIDYWHDLDECVEFVVWQINYSQTYYASEGGWATTGPNGDGTPWGSTQPYPDVNPENNSVVVCPPPPSPDAEIINVVITTGCIGDTPFYNIEYVVFNNGDEEITEYCIELWNEDYYICFDSELFGAYAIPPGEGQTFTSPFFEMDGPGSLFVISVDSVNDEIITGNNNETVWLPEIPECPVECLSDTVEIFTTLYEFDTLYVATYDTIVEYVELPQDTLVLLETDTLIEYVELPPDTVVVLQLDTVYIPWEYYFYDTVYVDVFDTIYVNVLDTVIITEIDIEYVYVTDTLEVPVVDTLYITQVDTLMQEVVVYEYIYQTDTIYDVVYNEVLVDCTTGLPCGDGFTGNDCRSVFVPNAFSPNNDGINDTFYAVSESYTCWLDWSLVVYNRWGNVVWFTDDPDVQWYGQVVDGMASDGVYVWTLIAKGVDGNTLSLDGTVTVFR